MFLFLEFKRVLIRGKGSRMIRWLLTSLASWKKKKVDKNKEKKIQRQKIHVPGEARGRGRMEAAATEAEEKWLERREERACGLRPAGVEDGEDCEKNKLNKYLEK